MDRPHIWSFLFSRDISELTASGRCYSYFCGNNKNKVCIELNEQNELQQV